MQRFQRFALTLTRRQALPPSLLAHSPVSMQDDVHQYEVSNGGGVRPRANNKFYPDGFPDDTYVPKPPTIKSPISDWLITQNTGVKTKDIAASFNLATAYALINAPAGVTIDATTG